MLSDRHIEKAPAPYVNLDSLIESEAFTDFIYDTDVRHKVDAPAMNAISKYHAMLGLGGTDIGGQDLLNALSEPAPHQDPHIHIYGDTVFEAYRPKPTDSLYLQRKATDNYPDNLLFYGYSPIKDPDTVKSTLNKSRLRSAAIGAGIGGTLIGVPSALLGAVSKAGVGGAVLGGSLGATAGALLGYRAGTLSDGSAAERMEAQRILDGAKALERRLGKMPTHYAPEFEGRYLRLSDGIPEKLAENRSWGFVHPHTGEAGRRPSALLGRQFEKVADPKISPERGLRVLQNIALASAIMGTPPDARAHRMDALAATGEVDDDRKRLRRRSLLPVPSSGPPPDDAADDKEKVQGNNRKKKNI